MKCIDCAYLYRTASIYANRYLCLKHNMYQRKPKQMSCSEFKQKNEYCDANAEFNCSTCTHRKECLDGRENLEK